MVMAHTPWGKKWLLLPRFSTTLISAIGRDSLSYDKHTIPSSKVASSVLVAWGGTQRPWGALNPTSMSQKAAESPNPY